ncbi:hypothetical protein [Saccharopolyspora sp. NPDC002376]
MNPQVVITYHETTDVSSDCENCGAEYAGVNAFYWGLRSEPDGMVEVCDDGACLRFAYREAAENAPVDQMVRREISVYPIALEAAA